MRNLEEWKAFEIEEKLIEEYKRKGLAKCNLTDGGEGISYDWMSDELKNFISYSQDIKIVGLRVFPNLKK